jgi:hypothetical protein
LETRVQLTAEFNRALEAQRRELAVQIEEVKARMETAAGKLPIARAWEPEMVAYAGSFVVHGGSCWQATRDTARQPGDGEDWACVAKGGRAGRDGASVTVRGEFDPNDSYGALDIVVYKDASYIAVRTDPGRPADDVSGWMMLAGAARKATQGPRGHRGAKGEAEDPATIRSWQIDAKRFRASPLLSNGQVGAMLELRPLFEECVAQVLALTKS